ncbi:WG repeat-containing protein [Pedobacter alpinus]|uniref:WG repeat-containing protein n=1 Tax=Pedobacter alpinus TaxID=1590643 RepID=A0ABW5TNT6_9SPHI
MKNLIIILIICFSLSSKAQTLFKENGKYGLKIKDKVICEAQFDSVMVNKSLEDSVMVVYRYPEQAWGIFTLDGEVVFPFSPLEIEPFSNGLAKVASWHFRTEKTTDNSLGDQFLLNENFSKSQLYPMGPTYKYHFIDNKGKRINEGVSYYYAEIFNNGASVVADMDSVGNWKSSLINTEGKRIGDPNINFLTYAGDGLFIFLKDQKVGYTNSYGEIIIPNKFLDAKPFNSNGLALVTIPVETKRQKASFSTYEDGKKNYYKLDLNPQYNYVATLDSINSEYIITFCKMGMINKKGLYVLKPEFDFIDFHQTDAIPTARVRLGDNYGVVNSEGKLLLPPIYQEINYIHHPEENYIFRKEDRYGLMNANGKILLDTLYSRIDQISYAPNIYYKVTINDKLGLVNANGEWMLKPEFSSINKFSDRDKIFIISKDDKAGLVSINGKILISPEFKYLEDFKNNLIKANKNDKYGLFNLKGDIILPFEYDEISYDEQSIFPAIVAKKKINEIVVSKSYKLDVDITSVE